MSGMVRWSSGEGRSMTRNGEARISHVPGVRIAQKRVWLKRRRKARACTYIGGSRAEHQESMTVLHWRVAPARVPAELSKVTASHQPWDSLPSLHFACAIALLYLSTAPSYSWARSKHTLFLYTQLPFSSLFRSIFSFLFFERVGLEIFFYTISRVIHLRDLNSIPFFFFFFFVLKKNVRTSIVFRLNYYNCTLSLDYESLPAF